MNIIVGTAPVSWGVWFPSDAKQIPWHRFLDEAADPGCEWIELGPYGYLPTDPGILQRELDRRDLHVCATFVQRNLTQPSAWAELETEVVATSELLATLGARFLVLISHPYTDMFTGELLEPPRLEKDLWKHLIDTTHKAADLVREEFGLSLVFHPEADTHVEYEDQIEEFLEQTDPDRVSLCLDTGQHAYRGGDPVDFMRRHHARIPYLHLKSVDDEVQKRVGRKTFLLRPLWGWTYSASHPQAW